MNILLINHYAGSNKHGMEYRPFYLAREWVRLGHSVCIVAASVSHVRSKAPIISGFVTEEDIEGIHYVWLKTPHYKRNNIKRVLNMLTFVLGLFLNENRFIKEFRPEVVIASSTYPLDIYSAHRIAKVANAKQIFEVHDLWPLSPIELGGMSHRHPFVLIMQWAENYAYSVSDQVVSVLPKADSYMRKHGMSQHKFVYIPNGIVVEEWQNNKESLPLQYNEIINKLKQEGRFLVGYVGSHGVANALDYLIDAAAFIQDQPVSLILVGHGPEKESLKHKVLKQKLTNVVFLPPISKLAIPDLLAYMDVLYIGWNRKPIYRFGISPNKLIDYMMSAKPVIHAVDAGNDIVSESGCGISIPPENPTAIANSIIQLKQMKSTEREHMGERGREYVIANHDYKRLAQKFLELMM